MPKTTDSKWEAMSGPRKSGSKALFSCHAMQPLMNPSTCCVDLHAGSCPTGVLQQHAHRSAQLTSIYICRRQEESPANFASMKLFKLTGYTWRLLAWDSLNTRFIGNLFFLQMFKDSHNNNIAIVLRVPPLYMTLDQG